MRRVPVWELELGTATEGDGDGSASGGHSQHPQHVWVLGSAQPPRCHRQAPCYKGREVLWSRGGRKCQATKKNLSLALGLNSAALFPRSHNGKLTKPRTGSAEVCRGALPASYQ